MKRLLVIDNYDSFTYNLVQMFKLFDLDIRISRADKITLEGMDDLAPDYLVIGPGPKDPEQSGVSIPAIRSFYHRLPILGVCLGMQAINEAFGGITVRSPLPMHGKTSPIHHEGTHLFAGLPSPLTAMRYHSLLAANQTAELVVTARTGNGTIMGLSHREFPVHGIQFHPESFRTEHGFHLIDNFLRLR